MIGAAYCAEMARYNHWQNNNLLGAADALSEAERQQDRGAFFGSIHRTFAHLLLGDTIWMARFDGGPGGEAHPVDGPVFALDWPTYLDARAVMDTRITDWADGLDDDALTGDLSWYSKAVEGDVKLSKAHCVTGFFNHQTHHRGQIHAMLTAAGARPHDTDLIFMPKDV